MPLINQLQDRKKKKQQIEPWEEKGHSQLKMDMKTVLQKTNQSDKKADTDQYTADLKTV